MIKGIPSFLSLAFIVFLNGKCVESSSFPGHRSISAFVPLRIDSRRHQGCLTDLRNNVHSEVSFGVLKSNLERRKIAMAVAMPPLKMSKQPSEDEKGSSGILFPPGLVFICSILLPYNNPYWVGAVFVVGLAAFNLYARKNDTA